MPSSPAPTLSVVVPAYNVAPFIEAAIDSLLAQTRPFDQIIVIDDGSTDATPALLQPYADAGQIVLHRIPNAGLGMARNYGAALAGGRYLYFFDADDLAMPTLCAQVSAALQAHPDTGLLFFGGVAFRDDPADPAVLEPLARHIAGRFPNGLAAAAAMWRAACFHPSACLYVSRTAWWHADLQFEPIVHEDAELIVRLCARAGPTEVLDAPLFRRRQRAGSLMTVRTSTRHMEGHLAALFSAAELRLRLGRSAPVFLDGWITLLLWSFLKNCEQLHVGPPWRALWGICCPDARLLGHLAASLLRRAHAATALRLLKHALGRRAARPRRPAGVGAGGPDHQRR